jgi:hypothetical protein
MPITIVGSKGGGTPEKSAGIKIKILYARPHPENQITYKKGRVS